MTTAAAPFIECDQATAALAVPDISAAVDFYTTKLGFKLGFMWGEPPTFAGVILGNVQVFLKKGTPDPKDCEVCFMVGDTDQLYDFHRSNGVNIAMEIGDRDYGIRDYTIRDLHGYYLTFGHKPLQRRSTREDRARRRTGALGEASGRVASGFGEAQAHDCEQLSRRNDSAHKRGRRPAHENNPAPHSGPQEKPWYRLRLPRELSLRREIIVGGPVRLFPEALWVAHPLPPLQRVGDNCVFSISLLSNSWPILRT